MNIDDILDYLLKQQNGINKRFRFGITACAIGLFIVEHRRKQMETQIHILTEEVKELKQTKGE